MKKVVSIASFTILVTIGSAFLSSASAQNITHRVSMFENDNVKVWKTILMPNSPLAMHRHEHSRTIVVLKGGTLTIKKDNGEREKVVWETGKAYWLDADPPGNQLHADVNETSENIEVMVIENKKDK